MTNACKLIVSAILALVAISSAPGAASAQTMTCYITTRTYTTTFYYSNGSTMTYEWKETEKYCEIES
jgi:hypothetical protein